MENSNNNSDGLALTKGAEIVRDRLRIIATLVWIYFCYDSILQLAIHMSQVIQILATQMLPVVMSAGLWVVYPLVVGIVLNLVLAAIEEFLEINHGPRGTFTRLRKSLINRMFRWSRQPIVECSSS